MVTRSEQPISRFPGISGALRKALLPILHTCSRLPQTAPEFFRRVWNEQRHWLVPLVPFLFLLYRPIRLAWGTWFGAGSPLTIQAFVPLLAVYLAWEQRHTYAAAYRDFHLMLPAGSKHRRGTIWPLLFSCLLMLVAAVAIVPSLIVLAFVLMVISVIYYVFGWFVLRMLWAPLTFLLLMTPPGNLIFHVLLPFQVGNAVGLGLALRPIFPQVATMGNVVTLPNTHLVISSELSGLNVSIAVLVLTVWLALRRGVRYYNYPVLLVLGLLVALVVNFVRLWIMAVAINSNPDFGTGVGRISFWIPVLIAFFPVRWLVDRFRPRQLRHPGEGEGIR